MFSSPHSVTTYSPYYCPVLASHILAPFCHKFYILKAMQCLPSIVFMLYCNSYDNPQAMYCCTIRSYSCIIATSYLGIDSSLCDRFLALGHHMPSSSMEACLARAARTNVKTGLDKYTTTIGEAWAGKDVDKLLCDLHVTTFPTGCMARTQRGDATRLGSTLKSVLVWTDRVYLVPVG